MSRPSFPSARWILALTVVVLLSYWKIVFTKQFSILWQWEMVSQAYAWTTYAAAWIHKGVIPLWDPFRYGGTSFIGEMQTGLFYPFKLALYLAPFDRNGLLSERAFNLFYVFSHWLTALWMFLLARYLKLSYLPALVAGICFGLGGFVQWTAWPNILDAMPWLPLVVLFVLRSFDSDRLPARLSSAGMAGLALGMTFLAGSLHIAIMDAIVVTTLIAYLWISRREKQSFMSAVTILAVVAITSILFGAVQILPSIEYSPLAYRWVGGNSPVRGLERIPYSVVGAETMFGPQSLFAFVLGEVDAGPSAMTTYFGVLPLILTIIGAWKYSRHLLVRYVTGLGVLAWIYTWGSSSFLHGVLYLIPNLEIAREADRFIYLTNFAMAVLAGFGVQYLFVDRKPGEALHLPALMPVLKWLVIGFAALLVAANFHLPISITEKTYLSFFFLAAAYALLVFLQHPRETRAAEIVLVFLIAWDLYAFNWIIQPKSETQKQNSDALAQLVADRRLADFVKAQPGMPRVHFDMEGAPNIGNTYGVPQTWAMSATLLADFVKGSGSEQQNLLGVRYTIRPKSVKSDATPVYSDDTWNVYENPNAMPRAWIEIGSTKAADVVQWISYEPNRLELEVTSGAEGRLVLGEVFYPGWTALVDGSRARIDKAHGLVRAVRIDKGTHRVLLRYRPASVMWGAILTVFTFIAVVGLFFAQCSQSCAHATW